MLWVLKRTILTRGSFEYPKHMFKQMGKKIIAIFANFFLLNWTYAAYLISSLHNQLCVITRITSLR